MRHRVARSLLILLSFVTLVAGAAGGPTIARAPTTSKTSHHRRLHKGPKGHTSAFQVGLASWYGKQFQGKKTASGEPFDMYDFTAAHPSLRLNTFAMVTNLDSGRAVVVRINDRGPFADGRIIDVSANAARALGFKEQGLQQVRLDLVASEQPKTVLDSKPSSNSTSYYRFLWWSFGFASAWTLTIASILSCCRGRKDIMIAKFFDAFFGCWHHHCSFPITVRPSLRPNTAASLTETYVVCLDCGKEFPYDWHEMKVITSPAKADRRVHVLATKDAA
jgi:peptidoglycan lytic transglycosylase